MDATSREQELQKITLELQKIMLQKEQLNHRLRLLALLKQFQQDTGDQMEDEPSKTEESEQIEEELSNLSKRKLALQALKEKLEGGSGDTLQKYDLTSDDIFVVERPPSFPAPQVITDLDQLPRCSSPIQCPYCEQFITTEVNTVIGKTNWLMCLVCTFIGCAAGCCLIPFCISAYKDVVHKCPKCRSHIHTSTKM